MKPGGLIFFYSIMHIVLIVHIHGFLGVAAFYDVLALINRGGHPDKQCMKSEYLERTV